MNALLIYGPGGTHETAARILRGEGFEVRCGESSRLAEELRRLEPAVEPDVVIVGAEVLRPLAVAKVVLARFPEAHVVFAPGRSDADRAKIAALAPILLSHWSFAGDGADWIRQSVAGADAARQRRKVRTTLNRMNTAVASTARVHHSPEQLTLPDHFLAAILTSAQDAILAVGDYDEIVTWNPAAEEQFELWRLAPSDRRLDQLVIPEEVNRLTAATSAVRAGMRVMRLEVLCRTVSGRSFPSEVTAAPILDELGARLGVSLMIRDVSDLRRAEQELREINSNLETRIAERTAELEAAVRELEGFTYSVSHDLRTPLRAINATSRMLEEDFGSVLPSEAFAMLRRQSIAASRMAALIDDLLRSSRISRQQMKFAEISATTLASEVAHELKVTADRQGVSFCIQEGMLAVADPMLLRFVYENLLGNAVKFSPNGGTVRVGRTENGVYFVSDEGMGFDMAHANKLFEPFQRLVHDDDVPGTGIGLTNVKRIVERHGGTVWAESRLGHGASFFFTLNAGSPSSAGRLEGPAG